MKNKNYSRTTSLLKSLVMICLLAISGLWSINAFAQCSNASAGSTSASPAGPFCGSGTTTLSTTAPNGTLSYQWQSSSSYGGTYTDISGATNSSYNTGAVTSTTYYKLVATCPDDASSDISNIITVAVNPLPSVSATNSSPVCSGNDVALNAPGGFTSYAWTGTGTINNASSASATVVAPSDGNIYTVVVTDANGCTNFATTTVSINNLPGVSASNTSPVCSGSNVSLNGSSGTATAYSWTGPGIINSASSSSAVAVAPANGNTFTLVVTDANGCSNTTTTSVTVNANPAINITGTLSFCTGSSTLLTGNATAGSGSITGYQWVYNGSTNLGTASTQSAATGGTYMAFVYNSNGCSAASSNTTVAENALPTANISTSCVALLTGQTAAFSASATAGSGSITTYQWKLNGSTNVGSNSATYIASAAGDYTVTVTNSNGCTVVSNDIQITYSSGPMSGAYTIPLDGCAGFPSIAAAVAYLNANGLASGGVTLNITAGYNETAPAAGFILGSAVLSASHSAANPLIIQKSGAGADPLITAQTGTVTESAAGALGDAIFTINGGDYITINGIDLLDPASHTTQLTRMAYGYAMFKRQAVSPFDGCQNNTIKNCTITLIRANIYSIGIMSDNRVSSSVTQLSPTLATDANSNNKIYNNTIQNVYSCMYFRGYGLTGVFTAWDQNNDFGGTSAVQGNKLYSWGGSVTGYGLYAYYQLGLNFSYNTVDNYNGGLNGGIAAATGSTLYGVYNYNGTVSYVNQNLTEKNNTMVLTEAAGSSAGGYAFYNYYYGGQRTIQNNDVKWVTQAGTVCTGSYYCFYDYAPVSGATSGLNYSFVNNTVNNVTINNSIGTFYVFYVYGHGGYGNDISNNQFTNFTRTGATTGALYTMYSSYDINYTTSGSTCTTHDNTLSNINNGTSSGAMYAYWAPGGGPGSTGNIYNNTITGISASTTLSNSFQNYMPYYYSGGTCNVYNNTISNINIGGTIYADYVYAYYIPVTNIYNNTITGLSNNVSGNNIYGFYNYYSGGNCSIYKNRVTNLTTTNTGVGSMYGVWDYSYAGGVATTAVSYYNNYFGNYSAASSTSTNSCVGIFITSGGSYSPLIAYNTIYLNGTTAVAGNGSAGIYLNSATPIATLKNNLVINNSTSTTGKTIALWNIGTALTNYQSASNQNIFYAGTPSATNLIYWNGTTGYQTMAAFQAFVTPRESNSFSENTNFLSTTVGAATYLHVNPAIATVAESGGTNLSSPVISDDYDGDIRQGNTGYAGTGTNPDIGADEFTGTTPAPSVASPAASPTGNFCTATSRTVTATVTSPTSLTSVILNYAYNGTAQSPVTMTNPSGNTWTGVIPAATPTNAAVTWFVTATNSGGYVSSGLGVGYGDDPLNGVSAIAAASPSTICLGASSQLLATAPGSTVTIGTGSVQNTITSYPTPYGQFYGSQQEQYLIKASELSAQGLVAGNLTALAFNFGSGYTYATLLNFKIQIANTALTAMTTAGVMSGYTTVYGPTSYLPPNAVGWQSITFTTPYNWDGVSNIVINVWFSNCSVCNGTSSCTTSYTDNAVVNQTTTSFVSMVDWHTDGNCTVNSFAPSFAGTTYSQRPNIRLAGNAQPAAITGTTWKNSSGSTVGTGNPLTITPAGTDTYYAVMTDNNACSITSSTTTLTTLALPTAPAATNSSQCGLGVPTASVTSTTGSGSPIFKWYAAASGGSALQTSASATYTTAISVTTTFYVSESNGTCESSRTPVTVTVTYGDVLAAAATQTSVCENGTTTLSVTQSGGNANAFTYTWTANTTTGSGMPSPVSGGTTASPTTPSVSPSTAGTYIYTVTGTDGVCTSFNSVSVLVNPNPVINSAIVNPTSLCSGASLSLLAVMGASGGVSMPSGYLASNATSVADDEIWRVQIDGTSLNNSSNCSTTGGGAANGLPASSINLYSNYTATVAAPLLIPGTTYTGNMDISNCATYAYSSGRTIFIDLNRNGVIDLPAERVYGSASYDLGGLWSVAPGFITYPFSFTLPASATPGYTLMRVVIDESTAGTAVPATGTYTWGETEDYMVFVGGPVAGQTYQWYANGNPLTTGGNTTVAAPVAGNYNITFTATITSTGCSATSSPVAIVVNSIPTQPAVTNGQTCGAGVPTTTSVASTNGGGSHTFNWYSAASGGTLLQSSTSTTYTTSISATTTFYVTEIGGVCESYPRVAVTATVLTAPALTSSASQAVCNNIVAPLSVTSNLPDFDTYTWSPTAGLYTDPAGTIAYGGGSASTVYAKTGTAGTNNWTVTGYNNTSTCVNTSVSSVFVQPATAAVSTLGASLCVSGSTTMDLTPATGYAPGTVIQWQTSSNNVNFFDIAGANGTSYTTPTISSTTYYRVQVLYNSSPCITTASQTISVNNPSLASTTPGSRCGTGTVTLGAAANGGANINWYTSSTGGAPIGTGSPFTTPVINTPTTFYAAAAAGGSNSPYNLFTTSAAGNGAYGNLFDINVLNTVRIDSFSINAITAGTQFGIYYRAGTGIGNNTASTGWTFLGTATINTINPSQVSPYTGGYFTVIPFNVNLVLTPGLYSFALSASTTVEYTTSAQVLGANLATDANIQVKVGYGGSSTYPTFGFTNSPREWNGKVYYTASLACESARTGVLADVTTAPLATATATYYTPCAGNPSQISVSSPNDPYYNYSWTSSPAGFTATGAGPFTVNPAVNTAYTVTATDNSGGANNGCATTSIVNITPTTNNLNVTASAAPTAVCPGGDVNLTSVGSTAQAYCIPAYTSSDGTDYISNVTLNTINNTTGATALPCYMDYFNTISTTLTAGSIYTFSTTDGSYASTENMAAWIDFNQSGTFDVGEQILPSSTTTSAFQTFTANFTVPLSAINGATRLRVVDMFSSAVNSCGSAASFGETEDYKIIITGGVGGGGAGYSYAWSPATFLTATNISNPVAQAMTASQTYSVVITDLSTGCTKSASAPVTVKAVPQPSASSNAPICDGFSLAFFGDNLAGGQTSGNSWSWSGPSFTSAVQNPSIAVASGTANGTYTLTVTNNLGCTASMTTDVIINPNPVISIATQTGVTCFGDADGTVDIDATTGTSPYFYYLDLVPTTDGIYTGLSGGPHDADVTDDNGCVATTLTVTIGEPDLLTVAAGSNTPVCSGNPLSLNSTPTGGTAGYSYAWTGPNGAVPAVQNPTIASATVADGGQYNLQITDAQGCTATTNHTVVVNASPTAAIALSGSANKCLGQSATVQLTFTGTGPWNYTISGSGGPYSGTTSSNPANVNVTPAAVGVQNYTVASIGNTACPTGGTGSGTATVYVSTGPPTNTATIPVPASNEACVNTVMLITCNTITGQNIFYSWNTGTNSSVVLFSTNIGGPFSAGPFQTSAPQVYAQFGALTGSNSGYNVCVQGLNGCGSTNNRCVFIRGTVSVPGTITPPAGVVACANTTQSYSCGASGGASVYSWTLNGATAPITSGQGTQNVSVLFPNGFTSGNLCVTASLACGGSSTSAARCMSISNNPAIPATITGAASVCPGATGVPYSVPAVSGASGYFWSIPAGATIASGANTPSITVNFPASFSGASAVCVAATSACGSSVARCKTVSSGVPNQPAGVNGPTTNICSSTVQYTIVNPPGGVTYTWTNPAGTTIVSGQGSATILLNVSGTFNSGFLSVVANSVLCAPAVSPARTITIFGKPNLPSVEAANPGSWCNGGFVNFSVASVTPTPTWNWIVSNGTITAGQTSNNIDVTWGTGTGNVSVTAVNSCGSSVTRTQSWTGLSCREEGMSASGNFSVYPNPAHDKVTVSIYVEGQTQFNVKLRDMSGRVLLSEDHEGTAGLNAYEMDLKSFAKGIYTLEVQSAGDSWKTKVVVE